MKKERFEIDSAVMAETLGLKEKAVKAVLINRKNSVTNLLKSFLFCGHT
ncbi:MAG: hypothetical protein PHO37_11725 [Kiritimatiellae bacterium]|nr:hypothetical protein [Kiritimatiellia bacterium]